MIKEFLDQNLGLIIKDEWKHQLSVYEAGAVPDGDHLQKVIVWVRSFDIFNHLKDLIEEFEIDGEPWTNENVLLIRLYKNIPFMEKYTGFWVELFQAFSEKDEAEEALERICNICVTPDKNE